MATLGIDAQNEDLRNKIAKDINESGMPACLIHYMLVDMVNEISQLEKNEVQRQRQEYQKELAEADENVKESLKKEGNEEPINKK